MIWMLKSLKLPPLAHRKLWKWRICHISSLPLPSHLVGEGGADRTVHAVTTHGHDVADLAILDALREILQCTAVTGHQTDTHLEALCRSFLRQLDHAAGGGAVGGQRFLHEDIQSLLDGVLEMHPAEGQGCREDRDVPRLEGVHGVLVGVEADELFVVGNLDAVADLFVALEGLVTAPSSLSWKTSAIAARRIGPFLAVVRASTAAPLPRPPQPINAMLRVLSSAAWTYGSLTPASADSAW